MGQRSDWPATDGEKSDYFFEKEYPMKNRSKVSLLCVFSAFVFVLGAAGFALECPPGCLIPGNPGVKGLLGGNNTMQYTYSQNGHTMSLSSAISTDGSPLYMEAIPLEGGLEFQLNSTVGKKSSNGEYTWSCILKIPKLNSNETVRNCRIKFIITSQNGGRTEVTTMFGVRK